LIFGVLLLVTGYFLRSQPVRYCSAAVVLIATAKIFLLDMAGLTGLSRAFSFIGLGVILVGIGLFYQRLLFRSAEPARRRPANRFLVKSAGSD
jgi:Predicted membrane protein